MSIRFDVQYYNDEHEQALAQNGLSQAIDSLVQNGLIIPREEFLTYMLFREQRSAIPGWRRYRELRTLLDSRYKQIVDNFDLTGGTVRSQFAGANELDIHMVEAAGVGAGLALSSALFGLHEADWEKVPVSTNRGADFQMASDGERYIQTECKGSVVQDTNVSSSISAHRASIEGKKVELRQRGSQNLLIGTISAFPSIGGMNATIRVLDPEPEAIDVQPKKYRLLARLHYYGRLARAIIDSQFVTVVRNRLSAISQMRDWESLDGVPLLKSSGEGYSFDSANFGGRTFVPRLSAPGRVFLVGDRLLFDGLTTTAFEALAKQDFSVISSYAKSPVRHETTFDAFLPKEDLKYLDWPDNLWNPVQGMPLIRFRMRATLQVMPSGRVTGFGVLAR